MTLLGAVFILLLCVLVSVPNACAASQRRAALVSLPTIALSEWINLEGSRVNIFLYHVPRFLWNDNKVEVSLWWDEGPNRSAGHRIIPNSLAKVYDEHDSNLISATISITFFELTSDAIVRGFLNLWPSGKSDTSSLEYKCQLPTMCDELLIHGLRDIRWIRQNEWVAPWLQSPNNSSRGLELIDIVRSSMQRALRNESKLDNAFNIGKGLSGVQFRHFINNLGSSENIRYLEVGVYYGSTLFSMLYKNALSAVAIDSWDNGQTDSLGDLVLARDFVLQNLPAYEGQNRVALIAGDCFEVDVGSIKDHLGGRANVFFYDAGHTLHEHYLALLKFLPVLEPWFVLVVDDWNSIDVREGTLAGIESLGLDVAYKFELETAGNPDEDMSEKPLWHNGMAVFVVLNTLFDSLQLSYIQQ